MINVNIRAVDQETGDSVELYTGSLDVPTPKPMPHKKLRALARAVAQWVADGDVLGKHHTCDTALLAAWHDFQDSMPAKAPQ